MAEDMIGSPGLNPHSSSLWRKNSTEEASAQLTWKDLTVTVTQNGGVIHKVLEGLTGYAEPGTLTALMGPSGSGKSTLLDALAGRLAANAFFSGTILLNGRKAKLSYGTAAYVTQDDNLIGTLTVRETIMYSARLRLPDKMPGPKKQTLVETTIKEMGLEECADTIIGNWHLRGISGGEKRRVSIAIEILKRPRLLFLDEPTTGLDSASAFFVAQMLQGLSRDGRTVITSIHQPSSEVFELFDTLCLLSGGKNVYFGNVSDTCEFFAQAGFPCPTLQNPSDHFLRCVNSDFDKVKSNLSESTQLQFFIDDDPLERMTAANTTRILIDSYRNSQYYNVTRQKVEEISKVMGHLREMLAKTTMEGRQSMRIASLDDTGLYRLITFRKGMLLDSGGSQASFLMQVWVLTKRSFINMWRDVAYYWVRLVIYIVVTLCTSTIFYKIGTGPDSILSRVSCAAFVFGFITFMSIGGFPSFVEDMKIFQRERLNGHYGAAAFVISNTLSSAPYLMVITFASATICYFMVGLHPGFSHYIYFALLLYFGVTVVESLMMVVATIVPNFLMGIIVGAGIQGIFMLLSGFFRLPYDIPKPFWRYPMTYLSYQYWALQGQLQNDLMGLVFSTPFSNLPKVSGEFLLVKIFQVNVSRSKWIDLSVVFSTIIIYRVMLFIMIKINEDVTPWVRGYIARRMMQGKNGSQEYNSSQSEEIK